MKILISFLNKKIILLLIICASFLNSAIAQCTHTGSVNQYLGDYPSFSVNAIYGVSKTQMPRTGLYCNFGALFELLGNDRIEVTITGDNVLQHERNSTVKIPFVLYTDKELKDPIYFGSTKRYSIRSILDFLGWLGSGSKSTDIPMFLHIPNFDTSSLFAGTYKTQVTLHWSWNICKGLGIAGLCIGRDRGEGTTNVLITMNILQDCLISANNINFGSKPFIQEFDPVSGTISIACTKGDVYSVGLSSGENPQSAIRRMRSGNNFIAYDIYKGNGQSNEVWGREGVSRRASTDAEIRPGVGTGKESTGQIYQYQAKILPGQEDQPEGTYIDNIVIDVSF